MIDSLYELICSINNQRKLYEGYIYSLLKKYHLPYRSIRVNGNHRLGKIVN